ncbi:MAG: Unknown protein [uncultured Sulfurovum sp.]|uniref:Uncharacterized protein n=1 Tax=uncultured Sulfurovum sp. TaxID=269237 RepID=A0A6S6SN45_9BACT|nr:MAG: Unknown protein [uncultured Sulfurovum sp.]
MKKLLLLPLFITLFFFNFLFAQVDIPPALQSWESWVLHDVKDKECPTHYEEHRAVCAYPSKLEVQVEDTALSFKLYVKNFEEQHKLFLPYVYEHWVKDVYANGEEQVVLGDKKPFVLLAKGAYVIQGVIELKEKVKHLQLPKGLALVTLLNQNKNIENPKVDSQNRLWLQSESMNTNKKGSLSVSLYRKVKDGHPMSMQTSLHFRVSGKVRTVVLDGITLKDFEVSKLYSKLNARINADKNLEVELKAGEWSINIDSYATKDLKRLLLRDYTFKYANEETLSFASNEKYRTVEVLDAVGIDPTQTNIPKAWKTLPLYLLEQKRGLTFKELYKSFTHTKDDFSLQREMWLDFNGEGYSFQDNINAKVSNIRRLEASEVLNIGSVVVNHKPMLISTHGDNTQKGVELRESNINIKASGRYEDKVSVLPINGWDETFSKVSTVLHLPPGWSIFTSFGADSHDTLTWINQWNLMDIFLVLLLSISIFKLFGFKWSLLATFFLLLLWHEGDAPTYVWLWLLALVALLRVLESSKMKKILQIILAISAFGVALNVLQFSVYEIRTALYPQLEKIPYSSLSASPSVSYDKSINTNMESNIYKEELQYQNQRKMSKKGYVQQQTEILMQNKIDPNAVVQTGEGVPTWSWTAHRFSWQSAVGSEDKLEVWFVSPMMNKVLNFLKVLGMIFLLFMFLKEFLNKQITTLKDSVFSEQGLKALLLVAFLGVSPQTLKADSIPSAQLLGELKQRLLKAPDCLPDCVSMEKIDFRVEEDVLHIEMKVASATNLVMPLVGNRNSWLPQSVKMDDKTSSDLQVDDKGKLWVHVEKGVHTIHLKGSIKGQNQIMLNSLLPLHNVSLESTKFWKMSSNNHSYVELVNLDQEVNRSRQNVQSAIEAKVSVKRVFYFGLRWYVETEVKLLNSIDKPYTLNYKLLENESILNKEIERQGQNAVLHLNNDKRVYTWRSSLPITSTLALQASSARQVTERWHMDISSLWNVQYEKMALGKQENINNLLIPVFEPWHNEALLLKLQKNQAVKGKSLTIESSHLEVVQSQRYRDLTLSLKIKSSQAQQYSVALSNVKELTSVSIDRVAHYLQVDEHKVSIPLKAKSQEVVIKWREEQSTATKYSFAEINLGKSSVNSSLQLRLPSDQWILFTDGPLLGPAVLLWGMLLAVILFSFILGRIKNNPLKTRDWVLLGMGVSTTSLLIMIPIVVWILILRYKEVNSESLKGTKKNLLQVAIVLLTLVALVSIVGAVSVGLLGSPEMLIAGNNSYGHTLNWYSDRIGVTLENPTVISVSIWYYRVLMLIWAMWISFSLIKWLTWAWSIFSKGDMWSAKAPKEKKLDKK